MKPKHRIIHDAATPGVSAGKTYPSRYLFEVCSVGGGALSVKFELAGWQIRNMLTEIRAVQAQHSSALRKAAEAEDNYVK